MCETIRPCGDKKAVESLLAETTEMRIAVDLQGGLQLGGVSDIKRAVERSGIINFYLEPEDLQKVKQTIETADYIRKYFSGLDDVCPVLYRFTRKIIPLRDITVAINKSISPRGEILDSASNELAEIRARLKKLRENIIKNLEQMINDDYISHAFQDDFITLRNNRYVIPVRSDSKSVVQGVVHDQSRSKATFFIEPLAVVNLNNELQILQKEEYYKEIKILTVLTSLISEFGDDILADIENIEQIDLIHARALFSIALNAVEPRISADGAIDLKQCRHPMLAARLIEEKKTSDSIGQEESSGKAVINTRWEFDSSGIVPVDLVKHKNRSVIIITGANAGGKTVAMKTLGLFVLMTQSGIHIPAEEGSTIAIYDAVFADIGDEQNIEASLSTFSAHMAQIRVIVTNITTSSIVLLDELGSGTDPSEGGALAVSIVDFLREQGCFTVLTTHLNILKTYAYNHTDVENVSVEFDPDTLSPKYSLVYGVPGISNALAIANNIGIPDNILKGAEQYIDQSDRQISKLIHGLEKTQKDVAGDKRSLRKIKDRAFSFLKVSEGLLEIMKSRKQEILKNFESSARKLLRESEDELMKLIKEQKRRILIRPDDQQQQINKTRKAFSETEKKLFDKFPKSDLKRKSAEYLKPGQFVEVFNLKKKGIVVVADNKARKAEVAIGTMRVKTGFDELGLFDSSNMETVLPSAPVISTKITSETVAAKDINVIGMRTADAIPVVDKAIDNALLTGSATIEIIHGRGTGRLMRAIHEHLKDNQFIGRFETGDASKGGSGMTIVHMK